MFKKILVANRGETALRIIRTCKEMGIDSVVIHSVVDSNSMPVLLADEAICVGSNKSKDSYLNIPNIVAAAEISGADALHPGIGFLSENYNFANILKEHNITFIGPSAEHIKKMGDKITARNTALKLGIPVIPGSKSKLNSIQEAKDLAIKLGYPVILKASAGGGGKGMKVANSPSDLDKYYSLCKSEAQANFGDSTIYLEKYFTNPKHIEFQILADGQGNCVVLGERDCSIQRKNQKVVEEAPAVIITKQLRNKMIHTLTKAMIKLGYIGVGTIELLFENDKFYFMEMNTRLQVEHTITEEIYSLDLVREQIKIAAGQKLTMKQKNIHSRGHSIECRITAEDPYSFMPSVGTIKSYGAPGGKNVRVDSHLYQGYKMPIFYDNLIAKLITFGNNRVEAIETMKRALQEYAIDGIKTNIPLLLDIIKTDTFKSGTYTIKWLEQEFIKKN